jgi:hypothetical protein
MLSESEKWITTTNDSNTALEWDTSAESTMYVELTTPQEKHHVRKVNQEHRYAKIQSESNNRIFKISERTEDLNVTGRWVSQRTGLLHSG